MEESILPYIVSFIGLLLFIGLFVFVWKYNAKKNALLLENISKRGWSSSRIKEGRKSGYLFHGMNENINWSLELSRYRSSGSSSTSSSSSEKTLWKCQESGLKEGMVLIGPKSSAGIKIPDFTKMTGFMGSLAKKAMEKMLGEDADLINGLQEIPMGSGILSDRYMIFAHDENTVRKILNSNTERILYNWNKKYSIMIKLTPREIEITIRGHMIYDPEILDQIADLGSSMALSLK